MRYILVYLFIAGAAPDPGIAPGTVVGKARHQKPLDGAACFYAAYMKMKTARQTHTHASGRIHVVAYCEPEEWKDE